MPPNRSELYEAAHLVKSGRAESALERLSLWAAEDGPVGPVHSMQLEALIGLGRRRAALNALYAAVNRGTRDADATDALAFHARQLGRHELSNELYRRATELRRTDPRFWYNFATSERSLGRLGSALDACRFALGLDPEMRAAVLLRSELVRATVAQNNIADLQARLDRAPSETDAMFLSYALGKEFHETGRYEEAFAAFRRGAAIRRRSLQYDVAVDEGKLAAIVAAFADRGREPPGSGARHIFIVGLPRSGTTLTERILGGLPGVRSNNETDNFSSALLRHTPTGNGPIFERAAAADFAAVAAEYDELAGAGEHADRIIEKLPFNYLYVGAILRTFTDVSIIWVRRDPVDSCFAMYRTLFGGAYPFSYDFDDLARYYAAYDTLMRHWRDLYGERLIAIDYEDLVTEPAAGSRRLAAECRLAWRDSALDISQNAAASLTASASQVREGIYTRSAGTWRHYGRHLEPLRRKLADLGIEARAPDVARDPG